MRERRSDTLARRGRFRPRPARSLVASTRGTALLETAIALPMLLVLLLNAMNFATYVYDWIVLDNAARAATEYQIYNGTVVGAPGMPTLTQLENLVYSDSLLTASKVSIEVCSKNNGTVACNGTGNATVSSNSLSGIADPEPSFFTLWAVDLYYGYTPVVSALSLIPAGTSCVINNTTYTTCIHRQVVMRSMQ
jgi:Flp pilus assembly protein TadG